MYTTGEDVGLKKSMWGKGPESVRRLRGRKGAYLVWVLASSYLEGRGRENTTSGKEGAKGTERGLENWR